MLEFLLIFSFIIIATLVDPRYKNNHSIFTPTERSRNKTLLADSIKSVINPERRPSDSNSNVVFPVCHDTDDLMETFLNAAEAMPASSSAGAEIDSQKAEISEEIDDYFKVSNFIFISEHYFAPRLLSPKQNLILSTFGDRIIRIP